MFVLEHAWSIHRVWEMGIWRVRYHMEINKLSSQYLKHYLLQNYWGQNERLCHLQNKNGWHHIIWIGHYFSMGSIREKQQNLDGTATKNEVEKLNARKQIKKLNILISGFLLWGRLTPTHYLNSMYACNLH